MRVKAERHRASRGAAAKPLFALVSLLLSVIWLWNNAALCVAATSRQSASLAGSAHIAAPACHCLKCNGMGAMGGMRGMKCCCCAKPATGKNPVCLRALCDGEDEALARAVWLPPTLPVAAFVACPPLVAPVLMGTVVPARRLTARTVAPPAQPPRFFSLVKKNRRFRLS